MRGYFLVMIMSLPLLAQQDMDFFNLSLDELNDLSVVSASRREEPLREVPVPVTVITAEMIRKSGARNLSDVFTTFVPGMTMSQDHNELNVAMRGIYGSSQQKFLVMIEGHRLNTRVFSQANPDFGVGLEKIKQIEVLRGPGSSLYGNVALTAVVNIILFKGSEIGGLEVSAGVGNYGQRKTALLFGRKLGNKEFIAWANFYRSSGEVVDVPAERDFVSRNPTGGQATLFQFDDQPSYNLGMSLKTDRYQVFADISSSKYTPPFTSGGITGQIFTGIEYPKYDGAGLGLTSQSYHLGLKTHKEVGGGRLELHAYLDGATIIGGLVANPQRTTVAYPNWSDRDIGLVSQYQRDYSWSGKEGQFLAGIQLDFMELVDSDIKIARDGVFTPEPLPLMEKGRESIYSGFFQLKQDLSDTVLVNLGFRYDYKDRGDLAEVSNLAPRLALVYLPNNIIDWKLSYASSFVDAPYWYRYNQLASYRGGSDLKPEYLDAFQLTSTVRWGEDHHKLETNLFHNKLTDFVFRDNSVALDDLETPIYKNAGQLESMGVELSYRYHSPRVRLNGNTTWQRALDAMDYGEVDGHIYNVPSISANLVTDVKLPSLVGRNSWLNISIRHLSQQRSPVIVPAINVNLMDYRVDAVTLVNTGIYFEKLGSKGFNLDLRIYNLFNKQWFQGGAVQFPYPQPGRWVNLNLSYAF